MEPQLQEQVLAYLDSHENVDTLDLAVHFQMDHQKVVGAVKSIEAHGNLINSEITSRKSWELTKEGEEVAAKGSHEAVVFNAIPKDGISQAELMKVKFLCHECFDDAIMCQFSIKDISQCQNWSK